MLDIERWRPPLGNASSIGVVSTYAPTRCGIARFTASLIEALKDLDPTSTLDVIRLVEAPSTSSYGDYPVTMQVDPTSSVGIRAAAEHLNRGDLAIINHEFGIFGPDDGAPAVDLAARLQVPAISILHTVLPEPTSNQQWIIKELSRLTTPVVLCGAARDLLVNRYSIAADDVEVIPHGSHWSPQPVNQMPRRQLITWGLLGPGKGLERAIAAVAQLQRLDPPVRYKIVGRTHPNVVRNAGFVYRHSLQRLVDQLGLRDRVEFLDHYVNDSELFDLVRASDLVVVPYDNDDQVSSGVITEAIGLGRPVVATRFPYSMELIEPGPGLVVDHNADALAQAIGHLLEHPVSYRRAARAASLKSDALSWRNAARQYLMLIESLSPARATA